MGLAKAVKNLGTVQKGGGSLTSADQVLAADGFNPNNPGKFQIHRSVPLLQQERSFSMVEADKLDNLADKRSIEAKATEKGLTAMKKIKKADVKEQLAFNDYKRHEAKQTLNQVSSNVQTAKTINGLRTNYGQLYQGMNAAIDSQNMQQKAIFGNSEKAAKFKSFW